MAGAHLWGRRGPPADVLAPKELRQAFHALSAVALRCKQVRRIAFSSNLAEVHTLGAYNLLDPQRMGAEEPQLAEALSGANAHGSAGVRPQAQWNVDSHVFDQRLVPKALAGTAYDSSEVGLA